MESVFAHFPIKLNPIYAIGIQLALTYIPHFVKTPLLMAKLKKDGKRLDVANSRQVGENAAKEGGYIAALAGCHLNNFEALIYFSAATLAGIAVANGKNSTSLPFEVVEGYAGLFILTRTLYTWIYMTPSLNGVLRSLSFMAGMVATVGFIFVTGSHYSGLKA